MTLPFAMLRPIEGEPAADLVSAAGRGMPDPDWMGGTLTWIAEYRGPVMLVAAIIAMILLTALVVAAARRWRDGDFNAKLAVGFAIVQTGVTYIVIAGVFEFFHHAVGMPAIEAAVLAVFIEAATWAAVGFIYAHARSGGEDFGHAGPFFWITINGGGILAVLGSVSIQVAIGRLVIVAIGAYMWYLRLLQVTRPSGKPSRLRWSPKRLLMALGVIEPADEDLPDEAREWKVRRLTRAIRWSNSRWWPWSWLGARALVRQAETTSEGVLADARRRWAAAHLLRLESRPDSPVMVSVIEAARTAARAAGDSGNEAGTRVGNAPGIAPSADLGTRPGADVGIDPGADVGIEAGVQPGSNAGAEAAAGRASTRVRERSPEQRRADRLRAAHPEWTWAQLANKVGRDESTVRRWFREPKIEVPTQPAASNGHGPASTTPKETPHDH